MNLLQSKFIKKNFLFKLQLDPEKFRKELLIIDAGTKNIGTTRRGRPRILSRGYKT